MGGWGHLRPDMEEEGSCRGTVCVIVCGGNGLDPFEVMSTANLHFRMQLAQWSWTGL